MWFGWDNVFLTPDHVNYLQHRFQTVQLIEGLGKVPYMLGLKAPYYVFLGRKPGERSLERSSFPPTSPSAGWIICVIRFAHPRSTTPRGRRDLLFIAAFVLPNLLMPLLIVDLYPFSRAPMFADAPQRYCDYRLFDPTMAQARTVRTLVCTATTGAIQSATAWASCRRNRSIILARRGPARRSPQRFERYEQRRSGLMWTSCRM